MAFDSPEIIPLPGLLGGQYLAIKVAPNIEMLE